MINFGKYDRKVQFIDLQTVSDGAGGFIPTQTTVLDTFARAVQMSGSSNIEVAQLGLPKTYKIGVQYRSGFSPSVNVRVQYDGFDHMIKSVELNNERQRKEWIITLVRNNGVFNSNDSALNEELNTEL